MLPSGFLSEADFSFKTNKVTSVIKEYRKIFQYSYKGITHN